MKDRLLIVKQLDQQFVTLKEHAISQVPKQGWLRTLRKALGLTIKQLAKRLQVDPSRIVKMETAEPTGKLTLRTLKTFAEALECHFVYGFIPKTSLENVIRNKAKALALQQVQRTAHTMSLEEQTVNEEWLYVQLQDLTEELLKHSWKHLWET
jgi:predicted DNA-binding mobile mystery protein A